MKVIPLKISRYNTFVVIGSFEFVLKFYKTRAPVITTFFSYNFISGIGTK